MNEVNDTLPSDDVVLAPDAAVLWCHLWVCKDAFSHNLRLRLADMFCTTYATVWGDSSGLGHDAGDSTHSKLTIMDKVIVGWNASTRLAAVLSL